MHNIVRVVMMVTTLLWIGGCGKKGPPTLKDVSDERESRKELLIDDERSYIEIGKG